MDNKQTPKDNKNQWSESICLPQTSFPMRADLAKREPSILEYWQNKQIYKTILDSRKNEPNKFLLHDGPPYANGHFHVGHALNKILKDTINKFQILQGKFVKFVPGWDCHGLPIELAVIKELAKKKDGSEKDSTKVREACREYAAKYIKIQAKDQSRMGVFWDNANIDKINSPELKETPNNFYYTMSPSFEASILKTFQSIFNKNLIYKGKRPIHWCPSCATALAEAEVEYENHTSKSVYVKFPVANKENLFVVIWTTTPWTLPANLGLSFNPKFEYTIYTTEQGKLIIANGLEEIFFTKTGLTFSTKENISEKDIEHLQVKHPFLNRDSKILFGEHVTLDAGTGIVHTAPGHGHDDYVIGKKYNLETYCPVDNRGRYTSDFAEMEGVKVFEANDTIIDKLKEIKALIFTEQIEHSYPHCWRCHKPLIFRATSQWFLSIEPLRQKALETIKDVKWIPSWGENRFEAMVANRPDWCLSRQRLWGVPIPAFFCTKCNETHLTSETLEHIIILVEKHGIEVWFDKPAEELILKGTKCKKCDSTSFEKENDILDVWFDSGSTWNALLKNDPDLSFPADMYLEGSDQHRGWFQSSLWPSLSIENAPPYKQVLTHGYVLDEKGRAMSKSLGNVINPIEDIIPKYGADILRLWVASEDYRTDNTIGFDLLERISDNYRKIRNTFRYILGNLHDGKLIQTEDTNLITNELDLWVLHELSILEETILQAYTNYEFHLVYHKILHFCSATLSQTYFDIIRDSLYCDANPLKEISYEKQKSRISTLHTLNIILNRLNIWLAPILSYSMEEIKMLLNNTRNTTGSIFEQKWLSAAQWKNDNIDKIFKTIWTFKEEINLKNEKLRSQGLIGSSVEVKVNLPKKILINNIDVNILAKYFVVSEVVYKNIEEIEVEVANQEKCPRCWQHKTLSTIGLCHRCTEVTT